jgi:hypothetical protein
VVSIANSKYVTRKNRKNELVMDFKANLSRPQSNMFTTMTSNEEKFCKSKKSTNHAHVLFFFELSFNLFSIETNINRKKEVHHKLVFWWNH